MTESPSEAAGRPFPGARSTVPGAHSLSPGGEPSSAAGDRRTLPLQAAPGSAPTGWSIRLPVRAEEITVSRNVFVRERVLVRRERMADVEHVAADVRREELRTSSEGNVEVVDGQGG